MDDIFSLVRDGKAIELRVWLDNTENDLNLGDEHRFSLLHWAAKGGHLSLVEMLIGRGARVNATNMGDDTALHLAAAHGHADVVATLIRSKANVNAVNEHGNTPLHYACFWGYDDIAEELLNSNALIGQCNKSGETPLEKASENLSQLLKERAMALGRDVGRISYKDCSWLGYKTRSRDATMSRFSDIEISQLSLTTKLNSSRSGESWRGTCQGNDIVAKILSLPKCTPRISKEFRVEYPSLRIFNHPNIHPLLSACNEPPNLIVVNLFMPYGSLFNVLHGETGIMIDQNQALRFALDIGLGMEFLHSLKPLIPNLHLNSKHILIDEDLAKININDPKYQSVEEDAPVVNGLEEDLTAKINMADYKFTFQDRAKEFNPAWMSPEALQRKPSDINQRAADMWSFAVLLWELATREVPFAELSCMETGMKIALEQLRVKIPPGVSRHMTKLIKICMNEDPGKRPSFDMILPILEKIRAAT